MIMTLLLLSDGLGKTLNFLMYGADAVWMLLIQCSDGCCFTAFVREDIAL